MLCGNLDGRVLRGEWIHIYVWLNPFSIHLKLSQHCLLIGYIPVQNKKLKCLKKNYVRYISSAPLQLSPSIPHTPGITEDNLHEIHESSTPQN